MAITIETCICGHSINDHEDDDGNGEFCECSRCECEKYVERE